MLEPSMFLGLGAVAIWTHVRFPRLRPGSLPRAILHVVVAFGLFALLPLTLHFLLPVVGSHVLQISVALGMLMLALTYLLLSWVWLIARILHDLLGGTPRGGHPVTGND